MSPSLSRGREISHLWNHHCYAINYTYIKRTGYTDVKTLCNQLLCIFTFSAKGVQTSKYFDNQGWVFLFSFNLIFKPAYLKSSGWIKNQVILKRNINFESYFYSVQERTKKNPNQTKPIKQTNKPNLNYHNAENKQTKRNKKTSA